MDPLPADGSRDDLHRTGGIDGHIEDPVGLSIGRGQRANVDAEPVCNC